MWQSPRELSHCNVYYPKDGSAVWRGQAAQSYEALYGLYDLGSVGWQLHVAEFDGVKHVYIPRMGLQC